MLKPPLIALITAVFCCALTVLAGSGGRSLAVYFGGIVALAVCVPVGAEVVNTRRELIWLTALCPAAVAGVWLFYGTDRCLACSGIALAVSIGLAGLTSLLRISAAPGTPGEGRGEGDFGSREPSDLQNHPHFNPLPEYRESGRNAFASAIVIVLALAWLAWPIWLSPALEGHQALVDWLVPAHPLLAINGQLLHLGVWTERPLMYRWTILNQDVSYEMPTNPLWCILVHTAIGLLGFIGRLYLMASRRTTSFNA